VTCSEGYPIDTVSDTISEVLRDTIRRQDSEISYLRGELSAIRATLETVTRMLPAPAKPQESGQDKARRGVSLWVWLLLSVAILAGAGVGGYWLWLMR
jgi:hypothetical protein